jgi:hypothetical protein
MQAGEHSVRAFDNFLGQQALSLRSATFSGICPLLGSPFPLPNLTELNMDLSKDMGPIRISLLLSLCSSYPRLQRACVSTHCQLLQDVTLDQVVSLDSLVVLEFACNDLSRFIPFLKLPRLKWLHVTLQEGKVDKLADLLPHNGRALLTETTSMLHFYDPGSRGVELSGNGLDASFTMPNNRRGETSAGWFSDDTYIPFEQIEYLEFRGYRTPADFPIHLFKKLTTFRVSPCRGRDIAEVFGLLHPRPGAGIPCPSLREITYTFTYRARSCVRTLMDLTREREQVGYKLELVRVYSALRFNFRLEELKQHVGELRIDA